jgi:class 3 adenylate cyclase/predicted ATPase
MLLSSGWRPHGESKGWSEKPLGITAGRHDSTIFKNCPLTRARGLNLDIDGWLRGIGLEQYAQTFRDNALDADVLCDLTDEHLRELGLPLGARLKLLRAVAALGTSERTLASPEITPPAPRADAERRQVTVMFSDLVGSTALSARMDPEDLREVISAYQRCVAEAVHRFDGFVAKYMGDGVLVYFGYPEAHEDDPERAIGAGLELVTAVSDLKTHAALQTRVGIATGLVVVGDLIGSGASQEQAIVGETPNLAARLQGVAEPNSVVIAESTRKLLGNLFELEDIGAKDLKGISGPVRAWVALRQASVESRFEAMHATGLTDLVGREEELDLLLRRWSRAKSGEGQVVLLSGEAGIGKSRLTAVLLERVATEPHTRLRNFCSPQHTDSALYPTIGRIERAAGFTRDDTSQKKLDKLDALLAQSATSAHDAALFAEMLSLPNDGRYPALELTPQQRRQKTLEALTLQVVALSRRNPVLMIFEDAHWTDPTSLELFGRIVDKIPTLSVLLIVTFRPEFEPPWIGRPYVTALTINRLANPDIDAMINRVLGNKLLPANVRQDIIERTDGIPLFVEEMTKAVLEAESQAAAEHTAAAVPSAVAVPATLYASLMARLDRLGPAKEVAQIGAAIGREFSHALLASVVRRPEAELVSSLDRLTAAGLLFRQGLPPQASYLFKHALVQDAAYQSLLRSRRQQFHRRIAQTLVERFPEVAVAEPALMAHHYTEAAFSEQAIAFWQKAGQRAVERSANLEAIAHLTKGLEVLKTQPETPARDQQELVLQTTVGVPLIAVKGMAAPEVERAYARARQLCLQVGDTPQLFPALMGLWWFYEVKPDLRTAYELGQQLLDLAGRGDDSALLIQAHRAMGHTLFWRGEFASGRAHLEQAIARYDPQQHRSLAFTFGEHAGVPTRGFAAHVLWYLGYPDRALEAMYEALSIAAAEDTHPWTVVMINVFAAWMRAYRREPQLVQQPAERALKLATEQQLAFFVGHATVLQGWARVQQGEGEQAIADIRRGIAAYRATGAELESAYWFALLGEACATFGAVDEGLAALTEAQDLVATTGARFCHAELFRLKGELLLKRAEPNQAEASFHEAIRVASIQQAELLELRASTGLARLWRDQGKAQQARELLAPVYGWFTEGFDTLDLKEAKALLDELHA